MERVQRLVKPMFWAALLFAYVVALMPEGEAPKIASSDKTEHMIAFLTLSVLARLAFPRTAAVWTGLCLAGFGALIEMTQLIPSFHRDGNWADWLADCAAIVVGLIVAATILRIVKRSR